MATPTRAALSELVGADIPDMVTVTVQEESPTEIPQVLPATSVPDGLAEDDLEVVAGGVMCRENCV